MKDNARWETIIYILHKTYSSSSSLYFVRLRISSPIYLSENENIYQRISAKREREGKKRVSFTSILYTLFARAWEIEKQTRARSVALSTMDIRAFPSWVISAAATSTTTTTTCLCTGARNKTPLCSRQQLSCLYVLLYFIPCLANFSFRI